MNQRNCPKEWKKQKTTNDNIYDYVQIILLCILFLSLQFCMAGGNFIGGFRKKTQPAENEMSSLT